MNRIPFCIRPILTFDTTSSPVEHTKTNQGIRNVLAVFVVQFDVHKGNVVEWQYPEGKILLLFLFETYIFPYRL